MKRISELTIGESEKALREAAGRARSSYHGMIPYRFSFDANGKGHVWIRFYHTDMEEALTDSKAAALREYPLAHAFNIESDQDDESIRKSWGLPY